LFANGQRQETRVPIQVRGIGHETDGVVVVRVPGGLQIFPSGVTGYEARQDPK